MYEDAGYGENWQPAGNNARRLDRYARSGVILGGLFALGFVLIVIIVLSLIPIYISNRSQTTNTNIQTSRTQIINYKLQFQAPFDNFDSQTILSDIDNRQSLQAALTSILQEDSITTGSIVEITTPPIRSNNERRETSNLHHIICSLNVTNNKPCSSTICSNQFQFHVNNLLSNSNKITISVRYQQTNSTPIYWLYHYLPQTIQSTVSFVYVDPKTISSLLDTLLLIDRTRNQPSVENSTSSLVG